MTFNTGQVLLGFCAGVRAFDGYRERCMPPLAFLRIRSIQMDAGEDSLHPLQRPGEKAYETHVSWGLFEAERLAPGEGYGEAGLRQVDWALGRQTANGWVADCCLNRPEEPLTHTLGYYLRGVVEAHRLSGEIRFLSAARRTADALMLSAQRPDGSLGWPPTSRLDGSSRLGLSYWHIADRRELVLSLRSRRARALWRRSPRANGFVRRTIRLDGPPDTRGGVKGSFPVDGGYGSSNI